MDQLGNNYNFILQNIRSLRKNLDTLLTNINAVLSDFDCLFLTEIWISNSEILNYSLDGFSFYANCNDGYRAGGVAAFIKSTLDHQVFTLKFASADVLKIIIQLGSVKVCFVVIYRFNFCTVESFLEDLNTFLRTDKTNNKILLGDINLDLLKESQAKDDYLVICSSAGLESRLNSVTRPCSNSCIDHVFSESICHNFNIELQNLQLFVTDHNTIHISVKISYEHHKGRKYEPVYQTKFNFSGLLEELHLNSWGEVFCSVNPDTAYTNFVNALVQIICKYKTTVKVNRRNFKLKPWMSDSLLKLINRRNSILKKLYKNPSNTALKDNIDMLNSRIKILVPKTKEAYYKSKISEAIDLKSKWKVVNNVLNNSCNSNNITSIVIGDNDFRDPSKIANAFNDHFCKIPHTIIAENQENVVFSEDVKRDLVLTRYNSSNLFFYPVSEAEIVAAVSELKSSNSCGADGISSKLVKQIIFSISHILAFIFNMCLSEGVFPDELKVGIVKPLFKKDSRNDPNNYRPITLLNTFSKVFEKIIKCRLLCYLEKMNFLDKRQFGFVKNSSTEKALTSFLTPLLQGLNNNSKVSAIFIDFTKAFDTVNHALLLDKLSHLGVRGVALSLFRSYLHDRIQRVVINDKYSDERVLNVGVPQGSVLGPLLFIIYCNSIFDLSIKGGIIAFADDMAFLYTSNDTASMEESIIYDMSLLKKWCYVHNMILSGKSKMMSFSVGCASQDHYPLIYHSLACSGVGCNDLCVPIETVSSFKYLGLMLDAQLNFKQHVSILKTKLCQVLRCFYFLRKVCSKDFLKTLYYALFDSHLRYGLICWGGIYLANIKPLMKIQKAVLRSMTYLPWTSPSLPLFVKYKILPLRYLYVFKVLKMHYLRSGNRFSNADTSERYMLRNKHRIWVPHPNKEHFKRNFLYIAPKLFSKLPVNIVKAVSIRDFSTLLKEWLFAITDVESLFKTII